MELIAAATLFQVSIYYCTCVTNTFGNRKYQWEVVKPLAAANQFNYPHIVEDDPIHSAVIPHHFELVYYNICHYDSVVMEVIVLPPVHHNSVGHPTVILLVQYPSE